MSMVITNPTGELIGRRPTAFTGATGARFR
jgi:hypothetical protein